MTALRVLIVDDEAHARERVRRILSQDAGIEIIGQCDSGSAAIAAINNDMPDLVLLDVHMPEIDGFGVLRAVSPDRMPLVVFVTAFDEHAIQAFDVHAVDYVLKPVEAPRLLAAVERARQRLSQDAQGREDSVRDVIAPDATPVTPAAEAAAASIEPNGKDADFLLVKQDGNLHSVRARDVLWIEAEGNYARLHLADRKFLVRETMLNVERRLGEEQFVRIHRSTIVNIEAIGEMQPWFGGDYVVILKNSVRLKASRTYRRRLDRWVLG